MSGINIENLSCSLPSNNFDLIRLGHGSGGTMTSSLIEQVFLPHFGNEILNQMQDAAVLNFDKSTLAFTTDSYVVSPIFFPGGNIGSLAVHGTINDLAMRGAKPLYLMATFIMEEGLHISELTKVVESMHAACKKSNIQLIAADTKVVNKGAADKLFITTCGVGLVEKGKTPSVEAAKPGDLILISGDIGRHGMAIMSAREELDLDAEILSDSAPLYDLVSQLLLNSEDIRVMRDITRGGLATMLNEIAQFSKVGIVVDEEVIPIQPQVRAVCEILGLDPLYVACEGRFISIVSAASADNLLAIFSKHELGEHACIIGEVTADHPGRVVLKSKIGGHRILGKLAGEQLPRIC